MNNTLLSFYPIGNADTTLLALSNGSKLLFDYAHMKCDDDEHDKRIDLPSELNKVVPGDFDVVCFTHADRDHINRFSEYFFLEHAAVYQGNGRKKIKELWVPANILIETGVDGDARILRAEARYRLLNKRGIKIFSRPKKFRDWCEAHNEINYDDIQHLIVDAGTLIQGFDKNIDGVELFVHSPFYSDTQHIDRNNEAIVIQATFNDKCETKLILGSDIDSYAWADIVRVTRHFKNDIRLDWDIFHISHHCSYRSLNLEEKGTYKTSPNDEVQWLFGKGKYMCKIVSPSYPIEPIESEQPPHFQAANYYREIASSKTGEFIVTMEYTDPSDPIPLTLEIDRLNCARLKLSESGAATFVYHKKTERAGKKD